MKYPKCDNKRDISKKLQEGFKEFDIIEKQKDDFKEKYEGKIVAFKNGNPISAAKDMKGLKEKLKNKGISLKNVYIYSFFNLNY